MTELIGFLKMCADAGSKLDRFILEHGQRFVPDAETFKGRRGKTGQCFKNASLKALSADLTYCEGYFLVYGIQLHHGWCINKAGRVIDPTVDNNDGRITEYFGVPFTRDYVLKAATQNKVYGILGCLSKSMRLLVGGKVKNFKEELNGASA